MADASEKQRFLKREMSQGHRCQAWNMDWMLWQKHKYISLKVLVRSCVGNPRGSFFFRVRGRFFYSQTFREKLDITSHHHCIHYNLLRATPPAARGSGRRMVPHIYSSQASEGEASPQPNTMVLKHILAPAAGTA